MSESVATLAQSALRRAESGQAALAGGRLNADAVFRVMFGFYGQLWAQKFASGEVNDKGADDGLTKAKAVWARGLAGFNADTVQAALRRCLDSYPRFAPNLPEFVSLCRACAPREPVRLALPVSAAVLAERSRPHRERLTQLRASLAKPAAKLAPHGLEPLFDAICDAVLCGGGDEVVMRRHLDSIYPMRRAAAGGAA